MANLLLGLIIGVVQHEFLRGADYGRFKTSCSNDRFNTTTQRRVRKILEIPRHQVFYTMNGGYGNMQRIPWLGFRNCP